MTCTKINNGFVCSSPLYRLRLLDGRYIYMDWHSYCGPTFYKDKWMSRMIDDWWDDPVICNALDWFVDRGNKA